MSFITKDGTETPNARDFSTDDSGEDTSGTRNISLDLPRKSRDDQVASSLNLMKGERDAEKDVSTSPKQPVSDLDPASPNFQRPFSNKRWALVCLGLLLSAFLYGLDTTIAADVQGPVLLSLGEIEKLPWVGIGFPMGSVAVILLLGVSYGLFNTKYLFLASMIIFEVGSAICGAAPNMNAMICGRVIAGIGGAGIYLGGLTYFAIFTNHKERPIYNALIGLCWGTGCIVGPLIGGGFSSSNATWRWAFYINLPLAACFAPIYLFLLPSFNPRPDIPTITKAAHIDWLGAFFNALVFVLFQVTLNLAGATWAWNSPGVITLWVIFGVALIVFALQQGFAIFTTTEQRLFPVQFLKHRSMILLYICSSCTATTVFVTVYYIPLFFQFTKGDSAIQAAVRLLPFIILMVTFIMISGGSLPKVGRYMPYYVVSGVFMIIGGALMFTVDSQTSTSKIYGFEVLLAIGAGISLQAGYAIVTVKVKPADVPASIGFMNVAQIGSITIALSIAGCIFQNVGFSHLRDALAQFNFTDEELKSALGGAQSAILGQDGAVRDLALNAIVETISKVWIMAIAAGALCLVAGLLLKREKLQLEFASTS